MGLIVRGRVACLMLGGGSCATTSLTRIAVQVNCRLLDDWTDLLIADQNTLCEFDLLLTRIAMAGSNERAISWGASHNHKHSLRLDQ